MFSNHQLRLFHLAFFVECTRILLELKFLRAQYPSKEGERKFRRCLSTSSIKHEIRHFHVVVVQKRQRNAQKNVMHVQRRCFAN